MQVDLIQQLQAKAREIEAALRAARSERIGAIPAEARLWLAASPAWTYELAELVGFPTGGESVPAVVGRLHEEGLCDIAESHGTTRFWMAAASRDDVLTDLTMRDPALGARVGDVIAEIGRRISALGEAVNDEVLPPLVKRWGELAQHAPDAGRIVEALEAHIDECLATRSATGTIVARPETALAWIDAARPLGQLLGDAVASAIRQQGRRVDLVYRRREDQRHLEQFLPREAPIAAFTRLVEGPDAQWALHFLGAGGVGKTMLMRWISGQWAERAGVATARIDFDYLNPQFPSRAPALLLAQLMQDLRLYANDGADRSFALFESRMLALHERARTALQLDGEQRADAIDEVIEIFSGAVALLGRRVVLLLDTCEELAKARVGGGGLPENVRATFELLEGLHERLPSLRVVFCGRRPLASAGHGWSIPGVTYPARSYLSLLEVRGFTSDEARAYLRQEQVRADLVDAVLESSVDHARPVGVVDGAFAQDDSVRYMPFSLRLYTRWLREDPTLSAQTIRAGDTDAYIENRVYGRVRRAALRELVPLMALLGRFDQPLLRAVSSASATDFDEALGELHEQDWILREADGTYAISPHLQQRLLAYLERTGRTALAGTRMRAAAHLIRVTTELPLDQVSVSHVESAVRLLTHAPQQAFTWWSRMDERFARQGAMPWALEVVRRLLAEDGPLVSGPEHPLLVAVLATYAAARMHAGELTQLNRLWRAVVGAADDDPRPHASARYRLRAAAGRVVAWHLRGQTIFADRVEALLDAIREAGDLAVDDADLAAAVLAAFEGIVENAAREDAVGSDVWAEPLLAWAEALTQRAHPPELAAFATMLAARTCALQSHAHRETLADRWNDMLERAKGCDGEPAQRWLDWRAPDDLYARLLTEYIRGVCPDLETPAAVLQRVGDSLRPLHSPDADRLNTAIIRMRAATGMPHLADMAPWLEASLAVAQRPPHCRAHAELPFAFLLYWQLQALVYGHVDESLTALREAAATLERSANALPALQVIELARLRIARRWRLADEERTRQQFQQPPTQLRIASGQHAAMAFDARDKLTRRVPWSEADWRALSVGRRREEWVHILWRSIPIVDLDDATRALQWIHDAMAPVVVPLHAPAEARASQGECLLDELEASALAPLYGLPSPEGMAARAAVSVSSWVLAWIDAHPREPESALRLALRAEALGAWDPVPPSDADRERLLVQCTRLADRIGIARAATVAHGEGELLALRVPGAAAAPLARAAEWFATVEDHLGCWLADAGAALDAVRADDRDRFLARTASALAAYDRSDDKPQVTQTLPVMSTTTATSHTSRPLPEELERMADDPAGASLDALAPAGWRPWLVRQLLLCALQRDIRDDTLQRSSVLHRWIVDHYGVRASDQPDMLALPPDLAPWNVEATRDGDAAPDFEEVFTTGAWRTPSAGRAAARLTLRPSAFEGAGDARTLSADILFDGETDSTLRITWAERERPGARSPAQEHVARALRPWLAAHRTVRRVELVVASPLSPAPWESLLVRCLSADDDAALPTMVRRPRATRGSRSASAWPHVPVLFGHIPIGSLVRVVTAAWQPLVSRGETECLLGMGWGQFGDQGRTTADSVVHLIGDPVETGRGDFALQLADSPHAGLTVVYRGEYASREAQRDGVLVRMRDIVERYRDASLVVLQALPNDGRRTFADDFTAAALRRLAAELADAGVAAVMTVPPVPLPVSTDLLQAAARQVAEGTGLPSLDVLQSILEAAQRAIREAPSDPSAEQMDLALDCCLYLGGAEINPS